MQYIILEEYTPPLEKYSLQELKGMVLYSLDNTSRYTTETTKHYGQVWPAAWTIAVVQVLVFYRQFLHLA